MAYISQEEKKQIAPVVKKILAEYGMKGTLSVRDHMSLVLKMKDTAGMFEFEDEYQENWGKMINPYWFEENYADEPVKVEMLQRIVSAMKGEDFFDESDAMTDYFHVKHYFEIKVFPAK